MSSHLRKRAIEALGATARYGLGLTAPLLAPRQRFLIFCPGRVGSELLVQLLDSNPAIVCDSELWSERRALPEQFVDFRAVRNRKPRAKTFGFKLIVEHLRYLQPIRHREHWLDRQVARGTKVVVLERRNLLEQAISFARARHLGWHHTADARPSDGRVMLDPLDVAAHLYTVADSVEWFHRMVDGLPALSLTYEDDLSGPEVQQRTADRVATYLGVPTSVVSADLVRIAPPDPREAIANFDEIEALIRRTRFAHWLDA